MSNYLQQSQTIANELVEIKFKELLLSLVLNPKNYALACYLNAVRKADHDFEYVMRKNFLHELSLEDFAKLCGKSLSGFKRDFITHFGCPPGKWITEMRLKHAKSLLMTTDLTVNEICFDSGFKNPSHFSRAFRKQFEITPNQLRDRSN
ncbi:MAG TPA: AraC family transcriptional regulator [Cyclobacteriaceae bacterium]|nr:AraC family transcriptional regulator [Cyclobacteriaceae bacterium]